MDQLLQSNFVERVLHALKQTRTTEELSDHKILVETLTPFIPEAQQLFVLPYVSDSSTFKALRNVTAAKMVQFFVESTILAIANARPLLPLFEATEPNATAEARLFAALHLLVRGDYQLSQVVDVEKLLDIKLVDSAKVGSVELDDLKEWALKFLSQPRAKQVLSELVAIVSTNDNANSPVIIQDTQVQFFTCKDSDLYGFSGIGKIFINLTALEKLHAHRSNLWAKVWTEEITNKQATKITTALIGLHEAANMVIRQRMRNANLTDTCNLVQQRFAFMPYDAGVIAELRLLDFGFLALNAISADSNSVNELFQFFNSNETSAPAVNHMNFAIEEYGGVYPGIYKVYREVPMR